VRQKVASDHVNPLIARGEKLVPSVTRVFRREQQLFVFLQAYARETSVSGAPLVAFVTFFRDNDKVYETGPLAVRRESGADSQIIPLRFSVPLESFAAGRYECQVSVLDGESQKVAFWRAPIVIVP
jgi:hypothetical protein